MAERHIVFLRESGRMSDQVRKELARFSDLKARFKVETYANRSAIPRGVRGFPTILYQSTQRYEGYDCIALIAAIAEGRA